MYVFRHDDFQGVLMNLISTERPETEFRWWIIPVLLAMFQAHHAAADDNVLKQPPAKESKNGKLDSDVTVQFGTVEVPGTGARIDVRAYGTEKNKPQIPGTTFIFRPGDMLNLNLENYLNRDTNPALNSFEDNPNQSLPGQADDISGHASHEISIPNNGDMTNLHVHGLHVDPKQDDVTLIVLPEDADPGGVSIEMQRLIPTINRWWTRPYRYKIPEDHVPGTFWYHAHKHGATATQVENGMAGTLVMLPNDDQDSIIPGLWPAGRDRVMIMQGILNVGAPQGKGQGPFANQGLGNPVGTVNGQHKPTMKLPPGQLERWRFVFAGANHRGVGGIWAGKMVASIPPAMSAELAAIKTKTDLDAYTAKTSPKTFSDQLVMSCESIPGKVKLVAVDGVPMWESVDITPETPSFGAPGNRNDLLVQIDSATGGPYRVYFNYPLTLEDLAASDPALFGVSAGDAAGYRFTAVQSASTSKGLPAFQIIAGGKPVNSSVITDPYSLTADWGNFMKPWLKVEGDGTPVKTTTKNPNPSLTPMVPLLMGVENKATNGVDVAIRAQKFPQDTGWQPGSAGSGQPVSASILMNLDVSGTATAPIITMPSDADLNQRLTELSPATRDPSATRLKKLNRQGQLLTGIPSYVAPLPDKVDSKHVVVFDRGQFTFSYLNKSNGTNLQFRQFWLNGRQFNANDYVGNPEAQRLIQTPIVNLEPTLGSYSPNVAEKLWTHKFNTGRRNDLLVTNPGYFLDVTGSDTAGYRYEAPKQDDPPTFRDVTGLVKPEEPESTTSEEWLLVNNSDMFHPFHIHISPFFVEEIGQLNYDGTKWGLKNLSDSNSSPFKWVVGNWWDVILLPPHGYVKMKTWMNVPIQLPENSDDPDSPLVSIENANVYGSWVLHCHILRHEDRGMMTMVNTKPKLKSLSGTWYSSSGQQIQVKDDYGQLVLLSGGKTIGGGNFIGGLGNPFKAQPWSGAIVMNNGSSMTFNATDDLSELVLSDGSRWSQKKGGSFSSVSTPVDLSGNWIDGDGNIATVEQYGPGNGSYELQFVPIGGPSPVWWSLGTGVWAGGESPSNAGSSDEKYAGKQVLTNSAGRNQQLNFTVTSDGSAIVFGNGIRWMRH